MEPLPPHVETCTIGFHRGRLVRRLVLYGALLAASVAALFWLGPERQYYSRLYLDWRPLGRTGYVVLTGCVVLFLAIGVLGVARFALMAFRRHGIAITEQGLVDNSQVKPQVTGWPQIASVTPCMLSYKERNFSPRPVKGVELRIHPLLPDGSKGAPYSRRIGLGLLDTDTDRLVSLIQQAKATDDARVALLARSRIP